MNRAAVVMPVLLFVCALALLSREPASDSRLAGGVRMPERNGWIFVHLEGSPAKIGFQHGYLLASEIRDAQRVQSLELEHDTKRGWGFFRDAARTMLWPRIDAEYRQELEGISAGLKARGVNLDAFDLTAMNAWQELSPYYVQWLERNRQAADRTKVTTPDRCSAFAATGSYTRDGRVVIGHNAWTGYMDGARWNIVFDIVPTRGHRILMDGFPGLIHSADDFGMNDAGILITETTITQFAGYDPNGVPEFVRARKAMQYSESIDDFARIMREGNNGGYANNWLVADRKTNEIASLELGLKNTPLRRTRDGYFVGANFPVDPKLAREETTFPMDDASLSPNARRIRWEQLMRENKGRIDVAAGERFLSDHYDSYAKKEEPNERTLCGHIDLSPRGMKPWQPEYGAAGAVQAKIADASLAERMAMHAAMGHSCGMHFKAAAYLKKHPEAAWQKVLLRDLDSHPWTEFQARR